MATGFMVASAVYGAYSANEAGKDAAAGGKRNERLSRLETAEKARRLEMQQERELGTARVGYAASGFSPGGTSELYLDELAAEQERELQWLKTTGASIAGAESKRGRDAQSQANAQSVSTLLAGAAGASSSYSQFGWGF